ncbi:hypothetical protein FRB93_006948 [Tulasnella sp. JGI-2019a]|nr:hypothetical protein FRB93_006948 [Tulasnella sp. JGI-2019a]
MSITQEQLQKGGSENSFLSAFATNAVLLAVQVGAFTFLKGRLHRVYTPRSFLPPPNKRAEKLPPGPWKWLAALLTNNSKDLIRKNGLDAYLFIRFLRTLIIIFGVFTAMTWPILIPADMAYVPNPDNKDTLARISWGNIPLDMQVRYTAHIIVVYLLTFFVIWLIRREFARFIGLRHQFLISNSHSKLAEAKTVLITNLPEDVQTKEDLLKLLTFVPGGIHKVWIYRKAGDLPDWYKDRLKACKKLEKAECELLRSAVKAEGQKRKILKEMEIQEGKASKSIMKSGGKQPSMLMDKDVELHAEDAIRKTFGGVTRPTHRIGKIPPVGGLYGKKVDTIDWCKDEIVRLTALITGARRDLHRNEAQGSAFIQCNLQMGAQILSQVVIANQPLRMVDKWVDVAPDDVVWANIDDSAYEVRARYVTSWLAQLGLIVLWAFPVAFVGTLSNLQSLCLKASWLAWVCRLPKTPLGVIEGILPPMLLAILLAVLPLVLRALAWYENIPLYSLISLSVYKRYYIFLIVHGFLIVTISSSLTVTIPAIAENPSSAVSILATQLPDVATFFLTYTITTGLSGAASALLQIGSLIMFYINRWLFGDTPRKAYQKTFVMPNTDLGVQLPRISLLAAIALAYSVISPIINGLAVLSFFLLWVAYKYLFTWVYDQPQAQDTGGLYFPLGLSNLFVGLYIEQLCLMGLFFLATDAQGRRSALPQGILMVVLIAITLTAQILIWNSFGPLIDHLPTSLSTKKIQERYEKHRLGAIPSKLIPDLFSRDKVATLVRRKLNITSQPEDAEAILEEEAEHDAIKTKKQQEKIRTNVADLDMLTAVMNQARHINESTVAVNGSTSAVNESVRTSTMDLPGPSGVSALPTVAEGEVHEANRLSEAAQSSTPQDQPREAAKAVQSNIPEDPSIEDSDSDDDDTEDNAFNHPSTYRHTPVIWIPKDELGLSALLVKELNNAGVFASDEGAFIDQKGNVDVTRNPPDQEWIGGDDR